MPTDDWKNSGSTPEQLRQEGRREGQNHSAPAPRQPGESQADANRRQGAFDDHRSGK